jgi:hypothetical protein
MIKIMKKINKTLTSKIEKNKVGIVYIMTTAISGIIKIGKTNNYK